MNYPTRHPDGSPQHTGAPLQSATGGVSVEGQTYLCVTYVPLELSCRRFFSPSLRQINSSGIGRAAAIRFAKEGASVTIHGQDAARLAETKKLITATGAPENKIHVVRGPIEVDATQKALIDETVKKFGKLDVLVNSAGLMGKPGTPSNSIEAYDYVMNVNVRSIYQLTNLAAPHLEKTGGNIVNVGSVVSQAVVSTAIPYAVSKAALDHLTKNFASLLTPRGVRVNSVNPGIVRTQFLTRQGVPEAAAKKVYDNNGAKMTLVGRTGEADEQADLILYIAAPSTTFLSGSVIFNDGGQLVCSLK
uniref:NAD(P)-binding protein n=1 Tax=Panagrellus redivivus TaxID=6233 RepID=A0A7E4VII8_PANRE